MAIRDIKVARNSVSDLPIQELKRQRGLGLQLAHNAFIPWVGVSELRLDIPASAGYIRPVEIVEDYHRGLEYGIRQASWPARANSLARESIFIRMRRCRPAFRSLAVGYPSSGYRHDGTFVDK